MARDVAKELCQWRRMFSTSRATSMKRESTLARIARHLRRAVKRRPKGASQARSLNDEGPNRWEQGEIRPHMTAEEENCYEHLLSQSKSVVEYGIGGSTLMALNQRGVTKLVSVESDPCWVADVSQVSVVSSAISRGIARIIHVDIGAVGDWGKPIDEEKIDQWFKYPAAPWVHIDHPDLIFVDGRFRVACIIESAMKAQPHTLIAVHDFWNRPQYHVVLPFLEWHQSRGTLGVFRARPGLNREKAMVVLEEAQHIWQ
jgi:hypothetical protein